MEKKTHLPPFHRSIETEDGSVTFFSELFQEACHSLSGAKTETLLHYFEGCKIQENSKVFNPLIILEVGFGLGVGFLTTYETIAPDARWKFISLELDRDLLEWFKMEHRDHPFLGKLTWKGNLLCAKMDNVELIIVQGDARHTLPEFLKNTPLSWHAIYQDAFSPRKSPSLWTREWFELLKTSAHPKAILSTYSASTSVRKGLYESGWGVRKGEKFGNKRASTRAILGEETDPEILLQISRSPVPALTDLQIEAFKLR